MKLPTLLLTLLSTAAIAGPLDVIIQPSTYVNSQPVYVTQWNTPTVVPVGSGLTLISSETNGSISTFSTDQGLTLINTSGGLTTITPSNNQPMTICSSGSCFQ